jgi:hypothetical protein
MPRVAALLDVMQISDIIKVESPTRSCARSMPATRWPDGAVADKIKVITVRTTGLPGGGRPAARPRSRRSAAPGRSRPLLLRRRGAVEVRAPGTDLAPRSSSPAAAACRTARTSRYIEPSPTSSARRRRRLARRGRCRLRAERLPGRPDRQGRRAGPLHRRRHLRRHPASGRHEGQQGDRRHQQGRGSADLPGRRLRPRRRPLQARAGTDGQASRRRPRTRRSSARSSRRSARTCRPTPARHQHLVDLDHRLAAAPTGREKFMGMHFMNPVPVMQLVELIRGIATDQETWDRCARSCASWARRGQCRGFPGLHRQPHPDADDQRGGLHAV